MWECRKQGVGNRSWNQKTKPTSAAELGAPSHSCFPRSSWFTKTILPNAPSCNYFSNRFSKKFFPWWKSWEGKIYLQIHAFALFAAFHFQLTSFHLHFKQEGLALHPCKVNGKTITGFSGTNAFNCNRILMILTILLNRCISSTLWSNPSLPFCCSERLI